MRLNKGQDLQALSIIGSVKIGEKKVNKSGKEYPVSNDFFTLQTKSPSIQQRLIDIYGEQPKELNIVFVHDDHLSHHLELRDKAGVLVGIGAENQYEMWGEKGKYHIDIDTLPELKKKSLEDIKVSNNYESISEAFRKSFEQRFSEGNYKAEWKEILQMKFFIVGSDSLGLFRFSTKGVNSTIPSIVSQYDLVMQKNGTVVNVPFKLHVEKHKSNNIGSAGKLYPVVTMYAVANIKHEDQTYLLT